MILKSYLADMDDPREKKLSLAIKEVAIASSGKVWRGEAIFNLVHVLHIRPVYIIPRSKIRNPQSKIAKPSVSYFLDHSPYFRLNLISF